MKKYTSIFAAIALFLASLNLRPVINSVSPILHSIREDLGMSAFVASLLTSIPVLCMGLFSPLSVKLGHRYGLERMISVSLIIIGIGSALRYISYSTALMLITAFVSGIGIAIIGPLLSGFIKRRFPSHVPVMISIYTIALAVGATGASGFTIPLQSGLQSWQKSLAVWAVLAFVSLLVWKLSISHKSHSYSSSTGNSTKLPWGNRKAWLLTLSFGMLAFLFFSLTAWLPPVIQAKGFTKSYAANMLTLFSIIQVPASLLLPWLLKRLPSRLPWLLIGSCFLLTGFAFLEIGLTPWIAVILLGTAPGLLFPLNLMLPIDEAEGEHEAAAWSAMVQSIGYIIGALGPILLGWLYDASGGNFDLLLVLMMLISFIMGIIQLSIFEKRVALRRREFAE